MMLRSVRAEPRSRSLGLGNHRAAILRVDQHRGMHMSERDEFDGIIERLSKTIVAGRRLLDQFKVAPRTKNKKLFLLVTLNELIRKSESVIAMARDYAWAGVGTVVRSGFETYADIHNLTRHGEDYVNYMIWMSFNQQLSSFKGFTKFPESGYAAAFEAGLRANRGVSIEHLIQQTEAEMDFYASKLPDAYKTRRGAVHSRGRFIFELAGIEAEYEIIYRRLSGSAHGRVSDIVDGISVGDEIKWPPAKKLSPPLVATDSLCGMLIESCKTVAKALRKSDVPFRSLAAEQAGG